MPLVFPSNPAVNQTYTVGGKTWVWLGTRWRAVSSGSVGGSATLTVSETKPESTTKGSLWLDENTGDVAVYFNGGWAGISGGGGSGGGVAAVYDVNSSSTGYFDLPAGTTAQRPGTPNTGMIRYNSTTGFAEVYTSAGWGTFGAQPPSISSVTPVTYNGESGTVFTVNGANFTADAIVKFIDNAGTEYTAGVVVFINSTQLTATTPQDFTVAQEPLDVKVVQASGQVTRVDCIDCGGTPTWSTTAGTIATYVFPTDTTYNISVSATDPDAASTISYAVTSGSLPSGANLNSTTGSITGNIPNPNASSVTSNFDITATDNAGNQSARSFNIIRQWADGSTSARAAISANAIITLTGTASDGTYWLKPTASPSAFQAPCNFTYVPGFGLTCVIKGGGGVGFDPNDAYWENSTLINENDFSLVNSVRSKYASFLYMPFTRWYFKLGGTTYNTTFARAGGQISSFQAAMLLVWNDANNRSSPHYGQNSDYRTITGADPAITGQMGTEIYMMGMDLKHQGHYDGQSGGGRVRVGSICDESTGAGGTGGQAYTNAGSAFGIGVAGGNPLIHGVAGYKGWTDSAVNNVNSQHSVWIV